MSWEHPTPEEHKNFSSCYQVWYSTVSHEGWDRRWFHEKTYKTDGGAIALARSMPHAARVVQVWWDGESFHSEIIYESLKTKTEEK